ncbi:hypothetical protein A2160_00900 [Candidatus Beckwithbacteria bacterium RBG_13_42_9]|uniref:DJ-1/PfpI domain-containing protein n=1 Tax=Candidatus Beckwithbacteria bacterium RBG_13_42_9 TaxID=1797457 RepID=A0A1F5E337_9BACT|nr:MAG: hypothetical protein A2160_00900 [Candidatus Beckwithbacteria bacterium RBG_13_42_9]
MGSLSGKRVVIVIAPQNFQDEEYFQPKVILQASGAVVDTTAKTKEEEATGTKGGKARIDLPLSRVSPKDYHGIIFVGGPGVKVYFRDQELLKLAKEFSSAKKMVGASGIAPTILGNAGILKGKKVTVLASQTNKLASHQATVTDK